MCGKKILNAGFGGATVGSLQNVAAQLVEITKPKIVVVAIGISDALLPSLRNAAKFREKYELLLEGIGVQSCAV